MNKAKLALIISFIISLIALPLFTACAKPAEKTLKIGLSFALSGPAAGWGIPISNMQLLIAERINAEGGIKVGGDTYRIEPILVDTKYTPEGSVAAAHKLVYGDKVKFNIGGFWADETLPIETVTEPEKVLFFGGSWANEMIGPDKPYSYRIFLAPFELMPALWMWVAERYPEAKRIAAINSEGVEGRTGMEYFRTLLPEIGLELVSEAFYEYGDNDFTPQLTKILATNPDIITPEGDPPTQALIIKQARDMGYEGLFAHTNPTDDKVYCEIAGKDYIEGYVTTVEVATAGPLASDAAKELKQAYADKYGEWTSIALAGGYPYAMPIIKAAIEAAGSLDTDKVRAVLDSGRIIDTMFGPVTFGGEELYGVAHQVLYDCFVGQIKDGTTVIVDRIPVGDMLENWALWPEELTRR